MMPCRCRSSTLSLFIRSVAQIDLSATSNSAAAGKLQRHSFKPASSTRQFRIQYPSPRLYSTSSTGPTDTLPPTSAEAVEDGNTISKTSGERSAIAEISLDAIDALLAEAESAPPKTYDEEPEPQERFESISLDRRDAEEFEGVFESDDGYASPLKSLLKTAPQKKARPADAPRVASRSVFREPDSKYYTNGPADNGKKAKDEWVPPPKEPWMIAKEALKKKFPDGYQPLKRLSPDAISGIRALHAQMPEKYTTRVLSQEFEVSPESIRRILKSKWTPDSEEESDRTRRWFARGEKVWSRYAELGVKPPKKWRERGIGNGKPEWMKKRNAKFNYEVPPLPALITTAKTEKGKKSNGFEDDIGSIADKML